MKLNYDLLRELLLIVEELSDGRKSFLEKQIAEYIEDKELKPAVFYHLKFLTDAGYIERTVPSGSWNRYGYGYILDITPKGRNYLDSIRNEDVWNKIKARFADRIGSVVLDLIVDSAKTFLKDALSG